MQTGKLFEKEFVDAYRWYWKKHHHSDPDSNTFMLLSDYQSDIAEGTDMFDGEIHVDFTSNFDGKDHMAKIFDTIVCVSKRYPVIHYGIRIGNNHKDVQGQVSEHLFQVPVLVVGITMFSSSFKMIRDPFMEGVYQHLDEIVETGEDLYYQYLDQE